MNCVFLVTTWKWTIKKSVKSVLGYAQPFCWPSVWEFPLNNWCRNDPKAIQLYCHAIMLVIFMLCKMFSLFLKWEFTHNLIFLFPLIMHTFEQSFPWKRKYISAAKVVYLVPQILTKEEKQSTFVGNIMTHEQAN